MTLNITTRTDIYRTTKLLDVLATHYFTECCP